MAEHRDPPGRGGEEPHEPHFAEAAEDAAVTGPGQAAEAGEPGEAADAVERAEAADAVERAEAAAFAHALDREVAGAEAHAAELSAALSIRAAFGGAAPLGQLRARGLAREALVAARQASAVGTRAATAASPRSAEAQRARRGSRARIVAAGWIALGAVAMTLLLPSLRARFAPLPERLVSRSAGRLVPGPFPPSQTAADRLDLVTTDRLIALRELRVRTAAGRRR